MITKMFLKDKYPTSVLFDNTEQILQHPDGVKYIQHLQDLAKEMSDKKFFVCIQRKFSAKHNANTVIWIMNA